MSARSGVEKLSIEFEGRDMPRNEFLQNFNDKLIPFMRVDIRRWREFLFLLREIVKNIYDHANGRGYVTLEKDKTKRILSFKLGDSGTQSYDFKVLRKTGTSKRKSGNNFGAGLGFISVIPECLGIKLDVDTSHGFHYSGVLKF